MKKNQIKVGVTYTNGNVGRYCSARKVLAMRQRVRHYDAAGTISETGVRYMQVKGAYSGNEYTVPLASFSKWAKGQEGTE